MTSTPVRAKKGERGEHVPKRDIKPMTQAEIDALEAFQEMAAQEGEAISGFEIFKAGVRWGWKRKAVEL